MTDAGRETPEERPRPQYGEYATPEEQQARIRQPDATAALLAGQALDTPANASAAPAASAPRPVSALARPVTRWRLADRIVTFALLGYGLFNVVASSVQLFSFEQYAHSVLDLFDVDTAFSNVAQGRLWGTVGGLTLILGWALTAFLTFRQLRAGGVAFWIPVAGAVVFGLAATVFIMIPILNDPAFGELFPRVSSGG